MYDSITRCNFCLNKSDVVTISITCGNFCLNKSDAVTVNYLLTAVILFLFVLILFSQYIMPSRKTSICFICNEWELPEDNHPDITMLVDWA